MLKHEVLFEIGCEELPVHMVLPLAEEFMTNMQKLLHEAQLSYEGMRHYATPRRLALKIQGLQSMQTNQQVVRKGPAKSASWDAQGQPTPALLGFARSCDVSVQEIQFQETDKGAWAMVEKEVLGQRSSDLLPQFFQHALDRLSIPKPMFWGAHVGPFVRPVHWVLALMDDQVLPGIYFGVQAGRTTQGHRYHYPDAHELAHPRDYERLLRSLAVEPCFETRRQSILQSIDQQARQEQATVVLHEDLLDVVTSIVEHPVALTVPFAPEFLQLPEEVLIESMHVHQKCFALRDQQGKLLPKFITVTNIQSLDPAQVIAGNEKVMRARLADAKFFYEQDLRHPLSDFKPQLAQTLFQAKLGTLADQCERMKALLPYFSSSLSLNRALAERALDLSQCDLMSGMVGEFPELQGVMGAYYARHHGEDPALALALQEQYYPRFSQDQLPSSELGWLLSVLYRLDTLVGIFGIGQKPTGMKDPYKLRRHALALIRLALQHPLPLSLSSLLQAVLDSYPKNLLHATTAQEVHAFILERLPSYWTAQGIAPETIQAAMVAQTEFLDDLDARVQALHQTKDQLSALLGGAKRVTHLLKAMDAQIASTPIQETLIEHECERELIHAIHETQHRMKPLVQSQSYVEVLLMLSQLRPLIDTFFENVMIMCDDLKLRHQRLAMLAQLASVLNAVGDLAMLL